MHDEAFIREILTNPKDDVARQVYADWLEEQADPVASAKAEYLRVTVELAGLKGDEKMPGQVLLRWLASRLDRSWLAIVSHLAVENCAAERVAPKGRYPLRFDYPCVRGWQDLQTTADPTVRFCDNCRQHVHYCKTIDSARDHACLGHCVAVDLSVDRRQGDLEPTRIVRVGMLGLDDVGVQEGDGR